MEPTKRIIVNTIAQYAKAIINISLSLYSTRLILDALSISDFGIYAVVSGVVALLGFISNSLVVTTQRFISFYHGRGNREFVGKIFSNSLLLHLVFGLAIAVMLVLLKGWLFGSMLNIPPSRIETAGNVYYVTIAILLITIMVAPFKALFIARENIVYISIVEVCDGVIKLLFAISLAYVSTDRLIVYALMMCGIQVLNLSAFAVYGRLHYEECRLSIRRSDIDGSIQKQLLGFTSWTIYSMGTHAAKTQGIAVIINHFLGTLVNAAYGVASQVNAAISFVSSSIINAMNPQIMKAEGEGDRQRALWLAGQESKYSTILLSLAAIPILIELPAILTAWLKEVPEGTAMLCTFALVTCLVDQLTIGLNTVNRAQGKIALYTVLMFTPKLLSLPIGWWLLSSGKPLEAVMWVVLLIELTTALARIPYLRLSAGLCVSVFLRQSILPVVPVVVALLLAGWGCVSVMHFPLRFLVSVPLSVLVGLAATWCFSLGADERRYITKSVMNKLAKR